MKSESLAKFLPAAPAGWTREEAADDDARRGGVMGMFGGGTTAAATYRKGAEDADHHAGREFADGERHRRR